jgi:hypothetical protein
MMSRIELTDTAMDALVKMAEGNPGALTAMMDILKKHEDIDPQGAFGGIGAIMLLDTWEIYGTDIYILYNDKCQRDARKMLMIMRATQMGLFDRVKLCDMAADQMRQIDLDQDEWDELDTKVCAELDQFQKPAVDA